MTEKTPETLRARAELLRTDLGAGLTSLAVVLDGHASAWAADRKRIEALERLHTDVRALAESWGGIRETTLEDCVASDLAALRGGEET